MKGDSYRRENTVRRPLCPDTGPCNCDCSPVLYKTSRFSYRAEGDSTQVTVVLTVWDMMERPGSPVLRGSCHTLWLEKAQI